MPRTPLRLSGPQATDSNFKQRPCSDTASRSRRAPRPSFAATLPPSSSEGAGNAGRPMRPIAACAGVVVERTRVSQVTPAKHPAFPAQWFTAYFVLFPAIGLFCHRHRRKLVFADLTPASRRQNHTTWPSASSALVSSTVGVHRIPPRVRDDRDTPLGWDETMRIVKLICHFGKPEYFCKRGWTGKSADDPTGKSAVSPRRKL